MYIDGVNAPLDHSGVGFLIRQAIVSAPLRFNRIW